MYTHATTFDRAIAMIAKKINVATDKVRNMIDRRRNRNDFSLNGHEVIFIKDGNGYHFAIEY